MSSSCCRAAVDRYFWRNGGRGTDVRVGFRRRWIVLNVGADCSGRTRQASPVPDWRTERHGRLVGRRQRRLRSSETLQGTTNAQPQLDWGWIFRHQSRPWGVRGTTTGSSSVVRPVCTPRRRSDWRSIDERQQCGGRYQKATWAISADSVSRTEVTSQYRHCTRVHELHQMRYAAYACHY